MPPPFDGLATVVMGTPMQAEKDESEYVNAEGATSFTVIVSEVVVVTPETVHVTL